MVEGYKERERIRKMRDKVQNNKSTDIHLDMQKQLRKNGLMFSNKYWVAQEKKGPHKMNI